MEKQYGKWSYFIKNRLKISTAINKKYYITSLILKPPYNIAILIRFLIKVVCVYLIRYFAKDIF